MAENKAEEVDVVNELPNIFNGEQPRKEQQHVLGMRFENPKQLKHMLCNYVIVNGYQLCFMKNNSKRLIMKW